MLVPGAGLGLEIDSEYNNGFITASRRKELKPHLEKLFADSKLVGRHLVEDILKYKRLDGVEPALRTIAGQFCSRGQQAMVFRDRLSQLSIPILVIWGAEDRILPVVTHPGSTWERQDRGSSRNRAHGAYGGCGEGQPIDPFILGMRREKIAETG